MDEDDVREAVLSFLAGSAGVLMMFTSSTFEGHGTLQGGWPGANHGSERIH